MKTAILGRLEAVNKELWLVLSLFAIALLMNQVVATQRMVLSFYALPTLGSAYVYGRRHATLTAFASVLLVAGLLLFSDYADTGDVRELSYDQWLDIIVWGGLLIVTGYLMGSLYEHMKMQVNELRNTYHGVLMILRHFISNARDVIVKGSGTEFDPAVVDAFQAVFRRGQLEIWSAPLSAA